MKILHTADLHIGMKFKNYGTFAEQLCAARAEVLNTLVDTANDAKCDLFVIAGDLFDSLYVSKKQIKGVCEALSRFSGAASVILPGNHDCYDGSDRLWQSFMDSAPEHTYILHTFQPLLLDELGAAIHGAYCECPHNAQNHVQEVTPIDGYFNIALGHGSLEGLSPDEERKYFPMTRRELEASGMDVWLLGHTHVRYPDTDNSGGKIFNAGTPEPDGWDCTRAGNAWLIEIDQNRQVNAKAVSCGKYRFYDKNVSVASAADMDALLRSFYQEGKNNCVLRLTLSGNCDDELWMRREDYFEKLRASAQYTELRLDGLHKQINLADIQREFPEGSFPYRLLTHIADDEDTLRIAYDMIKGAMQ